MLKSPRKGSTEEYEIFKQIIQLNPLEENLVKLSQLLMQCSLDDDNLYLDCITDENTIKLAKIENAEQYVKKTEFAVKESINTVQEAEALMLDLEKNISKIKSFPKLYKKAKELLIKAKDDRYDAERRLELSKQQLGKCLSEFQKPIKKQPLITIQIRPSFVKSIENLSADLEPKEQKKVKKNLTR